MAQLLYALIIIIIAPGFLKNVCVCVRQRKSYQAGPVDS